MSSLHLADNSKGISILYMPKTKKSVNADQPLTLLPLNRKIVLDTLIKHETLLEADIAKEENLGMIPNKVQLGFLLSELTLSGHIQVLSGAEPLTYTITQKGIEEGKRLQLSMT
ncbi:MAG: hypothetical protein EOP48_19300 [Sphingobacteriales bacterium]|nr:MAG: hypothetical protein EOP48_19300 [Sphingobacteriales bacterium]